MDTQEPDSALAMLRESAWAHRLARQLLRDEHLAADVAQDALVVGLDKPAPAGATDGHFGWLGGIVRRLAQTARRRRQRREELDRRVARIEGDDPEQRAMERLRVHELLTRAVRELPEPYRTTVAMRWFEGRPPRAIARLRRQTPAAVRQQLHRGLALLRQRLDGEFGERKAWVALLLGLGLGQPFVPWLPVAITWQGLLAVGVAAAALLALAGTWWLRHRDAGQAPAVPETGAALVVEQMMTAPSARGVEQPAQDPEELRARVDRYLAGLAQADLFAGTVLVARGDEVLVHKAWGMADRAAGVAHTADSRCKLMSTTKSITAVLVMRLVQAGKLALTDPVGRHLPGFPPAWAQVTVHDLLDHTSGIPNLDVAWGAVQGREGKRGLPVWPAFVRDLQVPPLLHEPGAQTRYSNFNFELAGMVAEAAAGQPFRDLLREQVLAIAGMDATGFDDGSRPAGLAQGYFYGTPGVPKPSAQDMSSIQAAGGLWSTVGDLYRFHRALRDDTLLSAPMRQRMFTPRGNGFAAGWHVDPVFGHACQQHSGGANGYVANLMRFPDDDACVIVLSNLAFAPVLRISMDLAGLLFGVERPVPAIAVEADLDAAEGVFGNDDGSRRMVVRRAGAALMVFEFWGGNDRIGGRLLPAAGNGRFLSAVGDGLYEFAAGQVRTPWDSLRRQDADRPGWLARAGRYGVEAAIGKGAELLRDGDRLRLHIDGGWPTMAEVVPAGPGHALVLVMAEFGMLLRVDGELLRWTRSDGAAVTFTPAR